jgi:hypothetical protein
MKKLGKQLIALYNDGLSGDDDISDFGQAIKTLEMMAGDTQNAALAGVVKDLKAAHKELVKASQM